LNTQKKVQQHAKNKILFSWFSFLSSSRSPLFETYCKIIRRKTLFSLIKKSKMPPNRPESLWNVRFSKRRIQKDFMTYTKKKLYNKPIKAVVFPSIRAKRTSKEVSFCSPRKIANSCSVAILPMCDPKPLSTNFLNHVGHISLRIDSPPPQASQFDPSQTLGLQPRTIR
jgi:hypothetical protein